MRAPFADGTLVPVPERVHEDDGLLGNLFPLTDVMGTGHHAAVCASVGNGADGANEGIASGTPERSATLSGGLE